MNPIEDTPQTYKMLNGKIHNKVKGGVAGGGIGVALTVLISFIYKKASGEDLPIEVGMALGSVITWALSSAAMYFTPPAGSDIPVPTTTG